MEDDIWNTVNDLKNEEYCQSSENTEDKQIARTCTKIKCSLELLFSCLSVKSSKEETQIDCLDFTD